MQRVFWVSHPCCSSKNGSYQFGSPTCSKSEQCCCCCFKVHTIFGFLAPNCFCIIQSFFYIICASVNPHCMYYMYNWCTLHSKNTTSLPSVNKSTKPTMKNRELKPPTKPEISRNKTENAHCSPLFYNCIFIRIPYACFAKKNLLLVNCDIREYSLVSVTHLFLTLMGQCTGRCWFQSARGHSKWEKGTLVYFSEALLGLVCYCHKEQKNI